MSRAETALVALGLWLALGSFNASEAQDLGATLAHSRNLLRADRLLQSGEIASGELEILAELALEDGSKGAAQVSGPMVAVKILGSDWTAAARFAVTLLAPAVDREPLVHQGVGRWPPAAAAAARPEDGGAWVYLAPVSVPQDFQDAVVAVEDLATGRWGAALVELADRISENALAALSPASGEAEAPTSGSTSGERIVRLPRTAPYEPISPEAAPGSPPAAAEVIKLLPPVNRPAVGRVRFRTVTTMRGIRAAVFYLDGERAARDDRPPFSATLDLGSEPRARLVRVEALGYNDLALGADEITINLDEQPFAVRIGDLQSVEAGKTRVTAKVSVPPAERLDRVEFYKNADLVATLYQPPFEAVIEESTDPSDFLRVVAHLGNGDSREDARLLSERVVSERVEVNLVEVYAVVSDAEGNPVEDLTQDRFRLRRGRREIPIERFALADEVPLVLGLIIDSSESMNVLMADTKRAAARFMNQTILEEDRAFLVDFDTKPRLAQGLSGDLGVLVPALGRLQAGGNTAIYDAVVYSLAQFEREPGRRALVLLTDGRDYGSKFGPKRALPEARRLGVPVYIIAISDLANRMPGAWMQKKPAKAFPIDAFLEAFSEGTGGRVFSLTDMADLERVYDIINAELRSQYLLTFSTEEALTQKELESLEVSVTGRGLTTRTVVLDR